LYDQTAHEDSLEASERGRLHLAEKPRKPYPAFPLYPHATGRWAKKIRGHLHYFGKWEEPDAALARYLEQKDALHSGKKPRPDPGATTVKDLCNLFLNQKQALVETGELSVRTWTDYKLACDEIVSALGKLRVLSDLGSDDFTALRNHLAKKNGPHRLKNTIQAIRSIFKFADEAGLIERPMRFGPGFKRPSKQALRLHRARQGEKLFTREEILRLLDVANPQLKAMMFLAINCGFGNTDCGRLPLSALDLEAGWHNYARPKTGIQRRCPLWPETIAAIREALTHRPEPKSEAAAGLVFLTRYGISYAKETIDNPISYETAKLLRKLKINGRKGLGFYTFRHNFETIGGEVKDQVAVDYIMGHARDDMASHYRERISDERLRAVADYVRNWLLGSRPDLAD
jgi:integrase